VAAGASLWLWLRPAPAAQLSAGPLPGGGFVSASLPW
jgi:hypothetical protein